MAKVTYTKIYIARGSRGLESMSGRSSGCGGWREGAENSV